MVRLARQYVGGADVAEEVVQETWLAVMAGIDGFEARSSLRTWMYRIVIHRAKTRGVREGRTLPFSALQHDEAGPSVPPDRFQGDDAPWPGHWATPPRPWSRPQERLLSLEMRARLREAIAGLSEAQQLVLTLHDVEGMHGSEICQLLGITPGHMRVLLHRARSRLRADLEPYLASSEA
jgi:RNA polymerase sigma-70 factor (ECF subfamily)